MTIQEFNTIYNEHALFLLRAVQAAYRITTDQAQDVLQDVFQELWKRGDSGIKDVRSYLFTCCRRVIRKQRNKMAKTCEAVNYFLTDVADHVMLEKLEAGIKSLPEKQRQVVEYKLQGLHWKEIAKVMGISQYTVNNHLVVSWKNLKHYMQTKSENHVPQ